MRMRRARIPIEERSKRWGYVYWRKRRGENDEIAALFADLDQVQVVFQGVAIGWRKIDLRFCRISLGYSRTRGLKPEFKWFVLQLDGNVLRITCGR